MAKEAPEKAPETYGDDYEILPHKEILELREELRRLKAKPSERTLQISMVELAGKVDKLINIFTEALEEIRVEEGGLTFQEKMKPVLNRMEKILEQNSQIAEGIVALADMLGEMKVGVPAAPAVPEESELPGLPGGPEQGGPPPMPPPGGPMPPPGGPPPLPLPAGPAEPPAAKPLPSIPQPPRA